MKLVGGEPSGTRIEGHGLVLMYILNIVSLSQIAAQLQIFLQFIKYGLKQLSHNYFLLFEIH